VNISFKARPFYPDEQRLLRTLKSKKEKEQGGKIKFYHFLVAAILAVGFGYLTSISPNGWVGFIPGIITFLAAGFVAFMPYEMYKFKKRNREFMIALNDLIDGGTVATCRIKASRIALAKEYEDEGDLFIIEIDEDNLLCLWDHDYTLQKRFPCLDFEIYEEKFTKLLGRMTYSLSERISPLTIDRKAKWSYMSKVGAPGHLEVMKVNFDQFVSEINSSSVSKTSN
jgi:hypothetical protein